LQARQISKIAIDHQEIRVPTTEAIIYRLPMHLQGTFQPSETGLVTFSLYCNNAYNTGTSVAHSVSLTVMGVALQP
jgi:hypothetical protein